MGESLELIAGARGWIRSSYGMPFLLGFLALAIGPVRAGEGRCGQNPSDVGRRAAFALESPRADGVDPSPLRSGAISLRLGPETTGGSGGSRVSGSMMYPSYRRRLDVPLSIAAASVLLAGLLIGTDVDPVPPEGLDPSEIPLGIDRDAVGRNDESADTASDWTVAASIAFPFVVTLTSPASGGGPRGLARRSLVYAQALLFKEGITGVAKRSFSRARPFTYLPEEERPGHSGYDVTADRAFRAMPSGHASGAWTAVSVGITEHVLTRPDASSFERISIGFLGGALAASTAALRVEAGQHFPSDVVVGAAVGITNGVTLPLLHRGEQPLPARRSWLEAAAGTVAGAAVGALIASAL
jgi:membrane-associated phospholipid phosphatase